MTGYSNIAVYYKTIFSMVHHHKYSLSEVNDMYPFERDLFVAMISDYIEKQNEKKRANGVNA